jgi:ornithine carbamoyltransferase
MGTTLTVVCPEELSPSREVQSQVKRFAAQSGATITVTHSPAEIGPVDAVYTDVWVSMGEESRSADRIRLLRPYQVTEETLSAAGDAVFLHCLPAVRGNEMTSEVIDGMRSRVFVQAENRKHTIKAVLLALLGSA